MNRFTRRIGWGIGLLLVGLSLVMARAAAESGAGGILSGKIASIDPQQSLVKIKTGLFGRADFVVDPTSRLSDQYNQPMQLGDLRPGDGVVIAFNKDGQQRVVRSLRLTGGSTTSPEATPAEGSAGAPPEPSSGTSSP